MTPSTIEADRTLGDLVTEHPEYARTFESLGLDYCCGGNQTLKEACRDADIDIETVQDRLTETTSDDGPTIPRGSPTELVDHIVETHHEPLRKELPSLAQIVTKVARVHGHNHPELRDVETTFQELRREMQEHTEEEEVEVFPLIKKLDQGDRLSDEERTRLREEFEDLEADHEETAAYLDRIASLTDEYTAPDDACMSYRTMLDRLEALEEDTHLHVHTENNVLFTQIREQLNSTAGEV